MSLYQWTPGVKGTVTVSKIEISMKMDIIDTSESKSIVRLWTCEEHHMQLLASIRSSIDKASSFEGTANEFV